MQTQSEVRVYAYTGIHLKNIAPGVSLGEYGDRKGEERGITRSIGFLGFTIGDSGLDSPCE